MRVELCVTRNSSAVETSVPISFARYFKFLMAYFAGTIDVSELARAASNAYFSASAS